MVHTMNKKSTQQEVNKPSKSKLETIVNVMKNKGDFTSIQAMPWLRSRGQRHTKLVLGKHGSQPILERNNMISYHDNASPKH